MKKPTTKNYPLFALGFRPFFLLAGLSAFVLIASWNLSFKGYWSLGAYYPPVYWHAHEMLLGYTMAVLAGFLLTAVRNWTGQPTPSGYKLAGLCLLWLFGRILPFFAGHLPAIHIALADLAFVPTLIYFVTKPVIAAKQNRNLIFPGLLLLLLLGNSLVHIELLGLTDKTARYGFQLIVAAIVTIILVIAGRIFPFFTERGLPGTVAARNTKLDAGAVISAVVVFGLAGLGVSGHFLALAASVAASLNLARVYRWYTRKVWHVPLLWVLYTGYGWVILGFALTILSAYGLIQPALPLHAFTVGGIGVLTLGMMARVALGHTGRLLKASNTITIAFGFINIAAFVRVLLPIMLPKSYGAFIDGSTLAWLAAFGLFVYRYGPILTTARVDGEEG